MLKAFKDRLERKAKPATLYREVRNMPPPQLENLSDHEASIADLLKAEPGQITSVRNHDPYEWFEPRR